MQNRITNKWTPGTLLRNYWPHAVILILAIVLFATNYTPGTWLTGWDNLHPELNFSENIINRSIFSTWQSYQGLGIRAGNAHAAEIVRQLFLAALSIVTPVSLLRYLYHFLALFVGTIGVYELITRKLLRSRHGAAQAAGFCGAVFAMLNLGTMQNFYVPYEAFSHAFASFPWLILALYGYLDNPTKRTFLILTLINILAAPMFYVPTLFLVYGTILLIILTAYLARTKRIRTAIVTVAVIGLVNAFWLLPFAAFVAHGTAFVSEVKINRLFSQEAFLRNQKYGTIADVPILRGFLFDTTDMVDTQTGRNDFMMKPWITHLRNPVVYWGFMGLFVIASAGLFDAVIRQKPHAKTITAIFILSVFALLNDNPPTGWLFQWFQKNLPMFGQVFRFPYTKFIVPAIFSYACGLGYTVYFAYQSRTKLRIPYLSYIIPAGFLVVLITLNQPSFQGNFIYRFMRQNIPPEYHQLFTFFRTQPSDGKIANLPQPTFWGWTTYDWGYRGSGFPWYGIAQPVLDRAFDVWNPDNERYFTDLTQALYTQQTPEAIESIFDRYHISYLWLDEHVILPYKPSLLFYTKLKTILAASKRFSKVFEQGKQTVYRFDKGRAIQPVTMLSLPKQTYHPFQLNLPPQALGLTKDKNGVTLTTPVAIGTLTIPNDYSDTWPILGRVQQTGNVVVLNAQLPKLFNNGNEIPLTPGAIANVPVNAAGGFIQINDHIIDLTHPTSFLMYPTENIIATYPTQPTIHTDISASLFKQTLHNCLATQPTSKTLFGRDILFSDTLSLFGSESHPCVYEKLSNLITGLIPTTTTGIIQMQFEYKDTTDEHPSVCLTRSGETSCFFETFGTKSFGTTPDGWTTIVASVPIRNYPIRDIWIKLELASETAVQKQIQYRKVVLNLFTKPSQIQRFNLIDKKTVPISIPVSAGTLSLVFPNTQFDDITISPDDIPQTKQNCFPLGSGDFDKTKQWDSSVGSYIRYQAKNASSCDHFPIEEHSLKAGGVALFTTRNVSGRPLKTCIKIDPPGYCLTEDFVPVNSRNWTTAMLLVPPVGQTINSTYYIELDNYAVGRETRTNDLASVVFKPIPYPWITSLTMTSDVAVDMDQGTVSGTLRIPYSNPTMYVVSSVQASSKNPQLLVLSQSFDSGWLALAPTKTFPFLVPAGSHVLVNNWENGWRLQPASTPTTVYIFFWPQALEYLGFLLLPLPFLWALKNLGKTGE